MLVASILSEITDGITSAIGDYGLYAVFLLMFVDAVLPAASEVVMVYAGAVAAGAFAGQDVVFLGRTIDEGFAAYVAMALAGTIGYTIGSMGGWAIGFYGGRPYVERHGRWLHLNIEKLDRAEFESALDRFYRLCRLNAEGIPTLEWREELNRIVFGFNVTVRIPKALVPLPDGAITVSEETSNVGALLDRLAIAYPQLKRALEAEDSLVNVAINEEMFVEGIRNLPLKDGDRVELVQAFSGG